jgi:hypothetical protein
MDGFLSLPQQRKGGVAAGVGREKVSVDIDDENIVYYYLPT